MSSDINIFITKIIIQNIVPRAQLEPTLRAFRASVLQLHHEGSLTSPLYPCSPIYAAPSLAQRSLQTTTIFSSDKWQKFKTMGLYSFNTWVEQHPLTLSRSSTLYSVIWDPRDSHKIICKFEKIWENKSIVRMWQRFAHRKCRLRHALLCVSELHFSSFLVYIIWLSRRHFNCGR